MAFIVPSWLNEKGGRDILGEREEKGEEFTRNEN
jgi:hypothetical protein